MTSSTWQQRVAAGRAERLARSQDDQTSQPEGHELKVPSKGDRQRQLEESIGRAMDLYRHDIDMVRARSERLKALREAHEADLAANPSAKPAPRKSAKPALSQTPVTAKARKAVKAT